MKNKVLLLLADGMRPDIMLNCGNKFVNELLQESVYTLEGTTVMPSVTLPCHMSLFHSVPSDRHGIITNTYTPQVRPIKGLCEVLRESDKKCAFIYDWEELRDLSRPGSLTYSYFLRGYDYSFEKTMVMIVDKLQNCLQETLLDFIFLYIGLPDETGHKYGFTSDEYIKSVKLVWDNIKIIKDFLPEEYNFIITADHGGHGRSHGSDCIEDMTIPIIFNGNAFKNIDIEKIKTGNIIDIAPTIADMFGIKPDSDWEGKSLFV